MLNPKQRRFVAEYLKDQHATNAAIRAGYSKKTAYSIGSELLKKPEINAAVEAKLEKVEEKALVDATYVISRLREVAERCLQKEKVMEFDHELKEMVSTGEWQFDSTGANGALKMLGQYLKLFTEKIEHSGSLTLEQILSEARK